MTPKIVTTTEELLDVIRARRDELELSHETIDSLAGLSDRYFSKLVGPEPARGFGEMSLRAVLGSLALEIAVVVIVEDAERKRVMSPRWEKRRRREKRSDKRCVAANPINEEN